MTDQQSDDSSAASSGDEMLNLVPFSQEYYSSASPKKSGDVDSDDEIESQEMQLSQDSSAQSGKKRKYEEGASDENGANAPEMDEKARNNANNAFNMAFHDRKIGSVFWRTETKKGAKMIYPVRVATRADIVGLDLRDYNDETECPVEYVQYPHSQMKQFGEFNIASKKSLSPYYEGEDRSRWCATKLERYSKQLRRAHKGLLAIDLKTEEYFLQLVLERSLAEVEQVMLMRAKVDEAIPQDSPTMDAEIECEKLSPDEYDDEGNANGCRRKTRGVKSGLQGQTEPLRVGDRIAYYKPQGTAGDPTALCENTILYIDPKGRHPLTIDDAFANLPPDHLVKRIQRYRRGKLVDNDGGQWRSIDKFILKKEGDPNAFGNVLRGEHDRNAEIIQRVKDDAIAKMEKDGFCPRDMLR